MIKVLKRNVDKQELKDFLYNGMSIDDQQLYDELSEKQANIFQFSGRTAAGMCQRAQPKNFNDMISINCLSRPGSSFQFDDFVANGNDKSKYPPFISQFLKDTHGCILTQEQIIMIINALTHRRNNHLNQYIKEISDSEKPEEVIKIEAEDGVHYLLPFEIIKTTKGEKYAKDLTLEDELF